MLAEDVRTQIRMIPGVLRIWGGEGEREDPPVGDPPPVQTGQQDPPQDPEEDPEEDPKDKDDKTPSLEEQLDEEKRLRLRAERDLAKKNKAALDAEADKDAVKDRDRYKNKLEARDKFLTENLLIMEINKQKKYDFIDVDDVIRAFRNEEVTIDLDADEPSVEGLDLALKRIAKDKPHFLKPKKEEQEEQQPPSGSHPRNGKTDDQESEDRRLGEKFKIPGFGTQNIRAL